MDQFPTSQDMIDAAERIKPHAKRTPILTSTTFNAMTGAELYFKCENLQKIGAFKFRGGMNTLKQLTPAEKEHGIVTHSSGNHAQAIALASKLTGVKATIVMPSNAPQAKVNAVRGYGTEIVLCEPTLESRETTSQEIMDRTGAVLIHAFNDWRIIVGQGTAAMEVLEDHPYLDILLVPVGGGGLCAGTALAGKYFGKEGLVTIGVEPKGADDAYRSLKEGKLLPSVNPQTICDGLLTSLGDKTFQVMSKHLDQILTVEEEPIVEAMRLTWERMKIIIEPSSAVCLAAVMENKELFEGKKVGIIISGGNMDLGHLPWM